ncbi:hypothetical protein K2173_016100 [Erythroxylum novogranatense]|uniref:Cation/H+ exchanger domain-containing protein n=1 Tax=Erythroxylum novogranatense TaxID=1862640 RepID=A0AAV8SFX7_9ROSI|nr:hypothetical protein K2173_016100 [Erythroxylum novogranatense]
MNFPDFDGQFTNGTFCFEIPPKVDSRGVFAENLEEPFLGFALPNLEFQMGVMLFATQCLSSLLKCLGLPTLVANILVGIVFNPTLFKSGNLFTKDSINDIGTAATLGYHFFMFLSGVKMDIGVLKNVGRKTLVLGFLSVTLPTLIGTLAIPSLIRQNSIKDCFFYASLYSLTAFPVVIRHLNELKLLNTELGRLGLSTALISDFLSLQFVLASYLSNITVDPNFRNYNLLRGVEIMVNLAFIAFTALVLRPVLNFLAKRVRDGGMILVESHIYVIIALFLACAYITRLYGIFSVFGAFVFGLAVPAGPPIGTALVEKFEFVSDLFFQLFLTTCGMRVNLQHRDVDINKILRHLSMASVILFVKFFVCFLPQIYRWHMPKRDAGAFALIMCTKGAVDLAYISFLSDNMMIKPDLFCFMLFLVAVLEIISTIGVKMLYDPSKKFVGYQTRSIMDTNSDSELKIVSCVHVPGDVHAMIKLLNVSCTRDSPISVTVLHLIKLTGQSNPLFIPHRKTNIVLCGYPKSENVIKFFNGFEYNNPSAASVNAITAVSSPDFMYDDVCYVAFDKLTALVILPFHIRWSTRDGSIESEDDKIKELNLRILERAPCSVGILVDRHHKHSKIRVSHETNSSISSSTYKVAMIFIGGEDDREALTFAIRMTLDSRIKLTVVRLVAANRVSVNGLELAYDNMVLSKVKDNKSAAYREETANDAMTTTSIVKPMAAEYDMIIVGRRDKLDLETTQTDGLREWCEFRELGLLGDLLLSNDMHGSCSVLVVRKHSLH